MWMEALIAALSLGVLWLVFLVAAWLATSDRAP